MCVKILNNIHFEMEGVMHLIQISYKIHQLILTHFCLHFETDEVFLTLNMYF